MESNEKRENDGKGLLLSGWRRQKAKKATKRGERAKICCLSPPVVGKKATKRGERAKICCLSPPVVGKKATKRGKLSEIRCL